METPAEKQLEASVESLDALVPKLRDLKQLISTFVSNMHESIAVKRAEYEREIANLQLAENKLLEEIKSSQESRQRLMDEFSKEMADRDSASLNIKEMKLQQENLAKQKEDFESQLQQIRSQIGARLEEISEQRRLIQNQSTIISDKLYQYEQLLGLRIEHEDDIITATGTSIKFIFTNVDPENFSREVYFVLNPEELKIIETSPVLKPEFLQEAMSQFLKSKEIGHLWKTVRAELKANL